MAIRRTRRANLGALLTAVDSRLRDIERRPSVKRIAPRYITAALLDPEDAVDIRDSVSASGTIISDNAPDPDEVNEGDTWLKANPDGQYEEKVYAPRAEDDTPFDAWKPLVNEAGQAALVAANAASVAANNSNRVFYQNDAPSNPSTVPNPNGPGTVSYNLRKNDLWFDTDEENKPYKWDPDFIPTGGTVKVPQWVPATFGDGAISGLNAGKITVGTLGAGVVYAGTVAANKILAGQMGADVIAGRSIIADSVAAENITGSTITGKTIRTSAGDTRIELATNNTVQFFRAGTFVGALEQTTESVGEAIGGSGGTLPVIRLATKTGLDGPRLILADTANDQGIYMYSDDAGDDPLSANYIATIKYFNLRSAVMYSPQVDILGDQTFISASGTSSSDDPEEQAGVLTLAAGTLKIITNDMVPDEIKEVDAQRYFALGYDDQTSAVVLVNGGSGGSGTAGYFNGSSPGTLNNRIFYNNSNSYPGSARAGDILIWFSN